MTDLRTAAQQALDALYDIDATGVPVGHIDLVIDTLRAALAQQEQEPVAWRDPVTDDIVSVAHRAAWETDYGLGGKGRAATYTEPLYTHPPRREWRKLTDEEIRATYGNDLKYRDGDYERFARAIEAKLKEKNA